MTLGIGSVVRLSASGMAKLGPTRQRPQRLGEIVASTVVRNVTRWVVQWRGVEPKEPVPAVYLEEVTE